MELMLRKHILRKILKNFIMKKLHSFEPSVRWVGYITDILQDEFIATLQDIDDPTTDEEIVLPLHNVLPEDRYLINLGAIFYLTIGYKNYTDGDRRATKQLHFAR